LQRVVTALISAAVSLASIVGIARAEIPTGVAVYDKTWVFALEKNEVIGRKYHAAVEISAPAVMDFEWGTKVEGAKRGYWKLLQIGPVNPPAGPMPRPQVLASGVNGGATGGVFSIDLKKYLPPTPPSGGTIYHVQVIAVANTRGAPQTIEPLSKPVVITYAAASYSDFGKRLDTPEIYRRATLVLERFRIIEDQYGPGGEEYHTDGFMQELFELTPGSGLFNRPGRQVRFGPNFFEMNPPRSVKLPVSRFEFNLNVKEEDWPRRFTVVFSALEEDNGDSVGKWKEGRNELAEILSDAELLSKLVSDHEDEIAELLKEEGVTIAIEAAELAAIAAGAISGSSAAGPIAAAVVTGVVVIVVVTAAVVQDLEDDDYGVAMSNVTLVSNDVSEVHKLPGALQGSGAQAKYVLKTQELVLKGPPPSLAAGSFDGIVRLRYHWEFDQRAFK
jgi:hypothetical protein